MCNSLFGKSFFSTFCCLEFVTSVVPYQIHLQFKQKAERLYKKGLLTSPWIPTRSQFMYLFSFARKCGWGKNSFIVISREESAEWLTWKRTTATFLFSCSYRGLLTAFRISLKSSFSNSQLIFMMICNLHKQEMYLRFLFLAALDTSSQGSSFWQYKRNRIINNLLISPPPIVQAPSRFTILMWFPR